MTRRWFADELRRLVEVEGLTITAAAKVLGIPKGTASSAAVAMGIKSRTWR